MELTWNEVRSAKKPGTYGDGGGLYLQVARGGSKSWIYRYQIAGDRRIMGLGSVKDVSLATARDLAKGARALVAQGKDPIEARDAELAAKRQVAAETVTFKQAAEEFIEANETGWKNPKHRQQWRNTLKTYAYPVIGNKPISTIDTDIVLKVVEPIWRKRPETASRLRARIERVLSSAKARGLRSGENPAQWRGHLDQILPPRNKVRRVRHQPALPYAQMPTFMRELRALDSISARALELTILTATRTKESLEAPWTEFDLETGLWTIPKERMKGEREHRVPLSGAAKAVLEVMKKVRISGFVFPGWRNGAHMSDMAMLECLRGLRPGYTVHGFRSSFKDWAIERTKYPDFLSEIALAHVSGDKVRSAYARAELLELRRELMEAWAVFCSGET